MTNCEEAVQAFEQARGVAVPRAAPPPPSRGCGGRAHPLPPAGFVVDPAPGDLGPTLVGREVLYWWPDDGWQRGRVARLCPRSPFSHVVAYRRSDSALHGTVDTLLDAASYGTRWVLLSPAESSGVSRLRPRPSLAGA